MSTFTVPVVRIRAIEPIPGGYTIEMAVVGDYRSVVRRGEKVEPVTVDAAYHDARVTELLQVNNREVKRRLAAEAKLGQAISAIKEMRSAILDGPFTPVGRTKIRSALIVAARAIADAEA